MFRDKKVGICISNYVFDEKSLDSIKRCVQSILLNSSYVDTIYITDDSSPYLPVFEYYESLREENKVHIIRNHKNRGIASMKNLGLRLLSDFDYIILVDNDVFFKKGWDDFYLNGLETTQLESVHLSNIFNDNLPYKVEKIGNYQINYHTKYQGVFMCITKNAYKKVGGFPLLPERYGAEHYNWQVRLSKSLNMEKCIIDFDGGKNYIDFEHRSSSFETEDIKLKQAIINGNASDVILESGVIYMENEIDKESNDKDISIIIPFRLSSWDYKHTNNNDRLLNLMFVIDYYKSILPNAQMVIVEQDKKPFINKMLRSDVEYLFLKNNSVFNKSWAYNCCAKTVSNPYLIFMDSDAILKSETIIKGVKKLKNNFSIYKPYFKFLDLTKDLSFLFKNNMKFDWQDHHLKSRCEHDMWFIGGCVFARRKDFFEIGGFNEKFRGWGAEDDEFISRSRIMTNCGRTEDHDNLYHMYHMQTQDASPMHPLYQSNFNELHKVKSMDKLTLTNYINNELIPGMGNINKYENE